MYGFHTSTQHLNETLEPLNWIRVHPSCRKEHSSVSQCRSEGGAEGSVAPFLKI